MTLKPFKKIQAPYLNLILSNIPLFLTDHCENSLQLCFQSVPGMPDEDKVQKAREALGKC